MHYDGVIFDFNGTLLNDVDLCFQLLNELLALQGKKPVSKELYLKTFGFPIKDYYLKAGIDFSMHSFEELAVIFHNEYNKRSINCLLYPKIIELLESLKKRQIPLYVLSASKKETLINQLRFYKIYDYFDDIMGLDNNHAYSKESLAVEFKNNNPGHYLYVGDTDHDYEIGTILKADTFLVSCGHQSKEHLLESTKQVLNDTYDIIHYIK